MPEITDTHDFSRRLKRLAGAAALLLLLFAKPLGLLVVFCLHSDLFSYILLMPVVVGYLIWTERPRYILAAKASWGPAAAAFLAGGGLLAFFFLSGHFRGRVSQEDYLVFTVGAFVCWVWGLSLGFLGVKFLWQIAFPAGLLSLMTPLPMAWVGPIDGFFQHASAATAEQFLSVAGMAVIRDGVFLRLPGFNIKVAPECSGIHSTLVLAITALLAGHLFLPQYWKRAVLVAAVVPLAIVRNGFRIFVIGEMCVRIGPTMIDSPIHHKGGPIFFALSLVPFFLLLVILRKFGSNKPRPLKTTV